MTTIAPRSRWIESMNLERLATRSWTRRKRPSRRLPIRCWSCKRRLPTAPSPKGKRKKAAEEFQKQAKERNAMIKEIADDERKMAQEVLKARQEMEVALVADIKKVMEEPRPGPEYRPDFRQVLSSQGEQGHHLHIRKCDRSHRRNRGHSEQVIRGFPEPEF